MIAERNSMVYPACFLLLDFEERSTFHSYWITGTYEKPAKKPAAKGIGKKVAPTTPSIAKKPTAAAKSVNFEKRLNSFDSNVLIKYRPEDAAAKKETRMQFAQADKNGASIESKKPIVVKFGLNPATSLSEQVANAAQLELRAELVAEQQKVHALEERLKAANDQAAELAHALRHLLRERAASAPVQVLAWRNLNEFEYIGGGACGKIYAAELSPQNQGQSARDVVVKFFTNLKDFLDELEAFRNAGVHRHLAELVGVVHHPAIEPEKNGSESDSGAGTEPYSCTYSGRSVGNDDADDDAAASRLREGTSAAAAAAGRFNRNDDRADCQPDSRGGSKQGCKLFVFKHPCGNEEEGS
ncbi:protein kinase domain-containing protein [Cymbomonas tetramitiformis]|uniref:Protein kinase domain-containing protein n=1 Tax=Cymbomonas tetramitiformis TaxID=36881 RepID=A0AAE0GE78_9CHLO|nr:protein kinase domain-containing protein [Cymbomonas tetramitiformis]